MRRLTLPVMMAALVLAISFAFAADEKKMETAKVGAPAPAFTRQDAGGKEVKLSDYAGKIVVLEWVNPECPFVVRHYNLKTMTTLADKYKDKDVVWLGIATGSTADADKLKDFSTKES